MTHALDHALGVVLDAGAQNLKAGFIGEKTPRRILPAAVARFRHEGIEDGYPQLFFGKEAIKNRGLCRVTYPVEDGVVKDWDEMEKLWYHIFYSVLMIPPESTKILHVVDPFIPKGDREKMCEILFESFAIEGLHLVKTPILVLYASGRTTGIVYGNGFSSSYVVPIFEGLPLNNANKRSIMTGDFLTKRLGLLLEDLGYKIKTPAEYDLAQKMKEDLCYVAEDYDEEMEKAMKSRALHVSYPLVDGQELFLSKERFLCPEVLFLPSLAGLDCPGIVDLVYSSIHQCDMDIRHLLYANVILTGGSTKFDGFGTRFRNNFATKVKIAQRMESNVDMLPVNAAWTGGSILGSLHCFREFWMTKQEYEDTGSDRVNYKFM